jgi:hypothetical protein
VHDGANLLHDGTNLLHDGTNLLHDGAKLLQVRHGALRRYPPGHARELWKGVR